MYSCNPMAIRENDALSSFLALVAISRKSRRCLAENGSGISRFSNGTGAATRKAQGVRQGTRRVELPRVHGSHQRRLV